MLLHILSTALLSCSSLEIQGIRSASPRQLIILQEVADWDSPMGVYNSIEPHNLPKVFAGFLGQFQIYDFWDPTVRFMVDATEIFFAPLIPEAVRDTDRPRASRTDPFVAVRELADAEAARFATPALLGRITDLWTGTLGGLVGASRCPPALLGRADPLAATDLPDIVLVPKLSFYPFARAVLVFVADSGRFLDFFTVFAGSGISSESYQSESLESSNPSSELDDMSDSLNST